MASTQQSQGWSPCKSARASSLAHPHPISAGQGASTSFAGPNRGHLMSMLDREDPINDLAALVEHNPLHCRRPGALSAGM